MGALLTKVLQGVFSSAFIKKLLINLGIGAVTYGVPLVIMNYLLQKFIANFTLGSVPLMALQLMHLAKIDVAISIVIAAYFAKIHSAASNLVFKKLNG